MAAYSFERGGIKSWVTYIEIVCHHDLKVESRDDVFGDRQGNDENWKQIIGFSAMLSRLLLFFGSGATFFPDLTNATLDVILHDTQGANCQIPKLDLRTWIEHLDDG